MKFPKFLYRRPSETQASQDPADVNMSPQQESRAGSAWSTGLLMIGSALVGATAVAVWNRRTITEMRTYLELNSGATSRHSVGVDGRSADDIF